MTSLRHLENTLYALVRDARAADASSTEASAWDPRALDGHKYCLLTSYRASGEPVGTPVWFGISGERIYIRSGAHDGKIKRLRRNRDVLITPCSARGKPLGQPMRALARILPAHEQAQAEEALRSHYGLGRKLYRLVRRRIDVEYLEVTGRDAS